MRVAVLGAGAMGAIFGAALSRAGAEVMFFDKRAEVVEAIGRDGLKLSGVLGDFTLRLPATADPAALGKVDLRWCWSIPTRRRAWRWSRRRASRRRALR
jgi:2-dehydropantoate 2-reductase